MPRNFTRRVEVLVPVEDAALKKRVVEVLETTFADDVKAWAMNADGTYARRAASAGVRAQQIFLDGARPVVAAPEHKLRPPATARVG
jgi:polyphosphate kinase